MNLKTFDDSGVSVIVGALLLILITIIAAASLAMIVSQAEKQQVDRQAAEDAIKNEKLDIVEITPILDVISPEYNTLNITVRNLNIQNSFITSITLNNGNGDDFFKSYQCGDNTYNFY